MTKYEAMTLVISVAAIITSIGIPLVGHCYRKLQKPKLDIYEFEYQPLTIMYSTSGNRIKFNFSILCQNASCVIRSIEVELLSETNNLMKMRWATMEPTHLDWANGMGSIINLNSVTPAHPLLIDADALIPLSIQFEPVDNSEFCSTYNREPALGNIELPETLIGQKPCEHFDKLPNNDDLDILIGQLRELCFWNPGCYRLRVRLIYDANQLFEMDFCFDLSAGESELLRSNAEKLLLCGTCPKNSTPGTVQCVSISKDVEKTNTRQGSRIGRILTAIVDAMPFGR